MDEKSGYREEGVVVVFLFVGLIITVVVINLLGQFGLTKERALVCVQQSNLFVKIDIRNSHHP